MKIFMIFMVGVFSVALLMLEFKDSPCMPEGADSSFRKVKRIMGLTYMKEVEWFKGSQCEGEPIGKATYRFVIRANYENHIEAELASVLCDYTHCLDPKRIGEIFIINKMSER